MSPPDPVVALRQRAASLVRRPNDDQDQTLPNGEKAATSVDGGVNQALNGSPTNRQVKLQDDIV